MIKNVKMKVIFSALFLLTIQMVIAQNIGINTNNPQELLHLRSDSIRTALRLDNKKSSSGGFNYFSTVAQPTGVQNFVISTGYKNWTDLVNAKITNSDNVRLEGPALNVSEYANGLRINFALSNSVPSTAQIGDITFNMEARRFGTFSGPYSYLLFMYKASNNQPLARFTNFNNILTSSTDITSSFIQIETYSTITADILNLQDYYFVIGPSFSPVNGQSRMEIDRIFLEIEYRMPANGTENVFWSAGAKDGTFIVANSNNLNSNEYLRIDETGTTALKALKITKNAGPGKVLTSNAEGKAFWADIPQQEIDLLWLNKQDTAFYANGPVQVNNSIGQPAIIFDKGENRLNNGINFAETDNRLFNVIIDANNDQNNEQFNIYKDSTEALTQNPAVRFNLGGNNSWINGGGNLGVGTDTPTEQLDINGAIKIGNNSNTTTQAGTIRWNPGTKDFEGFNGTKWLSLTTNSGWGNKEGNENQRFQASDTELNDNFGCSVSRSGDYVVIGASSYDINGLESAYIFKKSGNIWNEEAILEASDREPNDNFGVSVSISGDYAIIGANWEGNQNQGAAYIFKRTGTTWTQEAKLTASDGANGDTFGGSVSLLGDYAIIGARNDMVGTNFLQGSAYIFKRTGTTWIQEAKLNASDGAASDFFGCFVSMSGNYAIVGAEGNSSSGNHFQGAAYIFKRTGTTWVQEAKLTASDGAAEDLFGSSVSLSGDYAIIGSHHDDIETNEDQGSAYIFKRTGTIWLQEAKLTASDGSVNDEFGYAVSISGEYAVIGAIDDDIETITDQGSAYVFKRNGTVWTQLIKLLASDGNTSDNFGLSVFIEGDNIFIGSGSGNGGTVYFFNNN
jgi:hypothetical protein